MLESFIYLFLTVAVVRTLVWLKETRFSIVLCHLDQSHGRPHCGIPSVDKHHHLRHDTPRYKVKSQHQYYTNLNRSPAGTAI